MIPRDEWLLKMAEVVSERSTCNRLHVGAVLARSHRVLSTGYNGNVSGIAHCEHTVDSEPCETAVHAEANALIFAARMGVATEGALLVSTHEPCLQCAKLIVNAGVSEVWFKMSYRVHDGIDLLRTTGIEVCQKSI